MAAVGAALMGKVLGHSEAEKAFRPWWDSLEDYLIYGLVMIGVVMVPTAIISGTPLDCNYCVDDFCSAEMTNINKTNPGFNAWWVKKFCTYNGSVDNFLLYYPYFLLLMALLLFALERIFLITFNAGNKLEKFYHLLVKEKVLGKADTDEADAHAHDMVDGGVEAVELRYGFKHSDSYFWSYLTRTVVETLVAGLLLFYMLYRGVPILEHSKDILCDVHGFYYECHGNPTEFYIYSLYVTCAITMTYILCNIYNFLWLVFPCFGKLSRVMSAYKYNMRERCEDPRMSDREVLGDLYDIYYNNRDLRMLLDLLATSSGVAPAIAIMTLFDKNFRDAMKPKIRYVIASRDQGIAEVQFQEPKSGVRAALTDIHGVHLMYVAEIVPPAETAVEAFESKFVPDEECNENEKAANNCGGDIEMAPLKGFIQRASFSGLKKEGKYTIKIRTVVNGKTICSTSEDIGDEAESMPTETQEAPV